MTVPVGVPAAPAARRRAASATTMLGVARPALAGLMAEVEATTVG